MKTYLRHAMLRHIIFLPATCSTGTILINIISFIHTIICLNSWQCEIPSRSEPWPVRRSRAAPCRGTSYFFVGFVGADSISTPRNCSHIHHFQDSSPELKPNWSTFLKMFQSEMKTYINKDNIVEVWAIALYNNVFWLVAVRTHHCCGFVPLRDSCSALRQATRQSRKY